MMIQSKLSASAATFSPTATDKSIIDHPNININTSSTAAPLLVDNHPIKHNPTIIKNTTSIAKSPLKPKRVVNFADQVRIQIIPNSDEFTSDEFLATYMVRQEYDAIHAEAARLFYQGNADMRGLEMSFSPQRHEMVFAIVRAVIQQQHCHDLALIYRSYASAAVRAARVMAMHDEQVAAYHLLSSSEPFLAWK